LLAVAIVDFRICEFVTMNPGQAEVVVVMSLSLLAENSRWLLAVLYASLISRTRL
jgi:hypothetical protein